jgi:Mg/Co/Ni transporter MgtE
MNAISQQETLLEAFSAEDFERVRILLGETHPSEIADLLESLPPRERETLWNLIAPALGGDVLSEVQDAVRSSLTMPRISSRTYLKMSLPGCWPRWMRRIVIGWLLFFPTRKIVPVA